MSRYSAKTASNTATHAVVRSWAALSASSFMSAARNWSRQMPPSPPLPTDNSSAQSSSPKRDHQQLPKLPRSEREQQQQKQDDRQHNLFRIPADTAPIPPGTIALPPNQDHHHLVVIQPPTFIDEQRLSGALRQLNVKVGVG